MAPSSTAWDRVVSDFRRVCSLKLQGRLSESEGVLSQVLPSSIAEWSRENPEDSATKKRRLQTLFVEEERRLEDAWILRELLFEDLKTSLIEELRGRGLPAFAPREEPFVTPSAPRLEALSQPTAPPAGFDPAQTARPWKPRRLQASECRSAVPAEKPAPRHGPVSFDRVDEAMDALLSDLPDSRANPPVPIQWSGHSAVA